MAASASASAALPHGDSVYRRLYLDLGDLLDIGDGRVAAGLVATLRETMIERDTKLVVSTDHIQDVWRARPDAIESLVRAVESFQPVLAVMQGPSAVEPLTPERRDIEVALCTNFRELVYSDAARKPMQTMTDAYDRIHAGNSGVQRALSSAPLPPVRSRNGNKLVMQAYITLARGWMGDDVEAVVAYWEEKEGLRVEPGEREVIVAWLRAGLELVPRLRDLADEHSVDVTQALRNWGSCEGEPWAWPGQHLALRIGGARVRNVTRKPKVSDLLDIDHAAHFPYVDIATCDANTLATVRAVLPKMTCPRQAVVIQNKRLEDVVAAVRATGRIT